MSTLKLTVCAKPVRQLVGEHGSTATCETKPIGLYLLIKQRFLRLTDRCTNEDSCILPS